jgi:hypothetical protein
VVVVDHVDGLEAPEVLQHRATVVEVVVNEVVCNVRQQHATAKGGRRMQDVQYGCNGLECCVDDVDHDRGRNHREHEPTCMTWCELWCVMAGECW